MKYITILCFIGSVFLTACTRPEIKDDKDKVKAVLIDYFDGIKNRDLEKMTANTTTDYLLFESGKVWNNDSLWADLQHFKDQRIEFRLDHFKVKVDNKIAHISYFNYGDIYVNDTLINTIEWIENATFLKVDGTWKIDFLHSTLKDK